jgi:hypothetical protein
VLVLVDMVLPTMLMLPPVTLPVTDNNPVTYCPVLDTTTTFAVPATPMVMLPLATAMLTFDVPLASALAELAVIPVSCDPLPMK